MEPQQTAFAEIKEALVTSPALSLFDQSRETVVSADASLYGLGAVLLQKQPDGELKPTLCASRKGGTHIYRPVNGFQTTYWDWNSTFTLPIDERQQSCDPRSTQSGNAGSDTYRTSGNFQVP